MQKIRKQTARLFDYLISDQLHRSWNRKPQSHDCSRAEKAINGIFFPTQSSADCVVNKSPDLIYDRRRAALTFYGAMGDDFCQLASGSYVFIARAMASVFGPRLFW